MSERIVFKTRRGLRIVGLLERVNTDRIIIMAHGFTGDKDMCGKFIRAAAYLARRGFAVFRFDFAGSGESQDTAISLFGQADDLESAIDLVRSWGYTKIGLLGHSFGALTAIVTYSPYIRTMVLTAPVTEGRVQPMFDNLLFRSWIKLRGHISLRMQRVFKISKEALHERDLTRPNIILPPIRCPVLIIHGDKDTTVPLAHSQRAIKFLPKTAKIEIIPGATHEFNKGWRRTLKIGTAWFEKYLPKRRKKMPERKIF